MNKMEKLLHLSILPPICIICGAGSDRDKPFCPDCYAKYSAECRAACPICGKPASECECRTFAMSKGSLGGRHSFSLLIYDNTVRGENRIAEIIIKKFKRKYLARLTRFLARDISARLMRLITLETADKDEFVIVYPPRSSKRMRELGFDHMKELTAVISEYTGIKVSDCLIRVKGEAQKMQMLPKRVKNAYESLSLKNPEDIRGKRVILCDDIITTGYTMSAASEYLTDNGAVSVFPVSVAKTREKN